MANRQRHADRTSGVRLIEHELRQSPAFVESERANPGDLFNVAFGLLLVGYQTLLRLLSR
jgi:hypothetical protein